MGFTSLCLRTCRACGVVKLGEEEPEQPACAPMHMPISGRSCDLRLERFECTDRVKGQDTDTQVSSEALRLTGVCLRTCRTWWSLETRTCRLARSRPTRWCSPLRRCALRRWRRRARWRPRPRPRTFPPPAGGPSPRRPWCPRAGRCSHALGNKMFPMLTRSQRRSSRGR